MICVLSWLRGSPNPLTLQGDSPEEAIAFLAAVIQNLGDEERTAILSRAVVVEGATAWQSLITSSDPLILVARLNQPEGIGRAIKSGHHVFVPLERSGLMTAILIMAKSCSSSGNVGIVMTSERARAVERTGVV